MFQLSLSKLKKLFQSILKPFQETERVFYFLYCKFSFQNQNNMKNLKSALLLITIVLFSLNESMAQEIKKYDYVEVVIFQKMNNSGKVKRIKVEDQESLEGKSITVKAIEAIKSTSGLLNYMNENNWEFVDRKAMVEGNNPIWLSYLFKKQK